MNVRSIASNSIITFSGRIVSRLFDFIFIMLLTRYLGPQGIGNYTYIFTYISIFATFVDLGMTNVLIREGSQNREKGAELMGNGYLIGIIFGCFLMLGAISLIQFLPESDEVKRLAIYASLSIFTSSRFASFRRLVEIRYIVDLRMGYIALFNILDRFLILAMFAGLLIFEPSLQTIVLIVVLGDVPGFLLTALMNRKIFGPVQFRPNCKVIKSILGFSIPLLLTGVFGMLNIRIDVLFLKYLKGVEAVGYFSRATTIQEALSFIPSSLMVSIYPILSRKIVMNREAFFEVFQSSAKYLLIIVMPIVVYLFDEAETVVPLLFGQKFISTVPVFKIVIFAEISIFVVELFYSSLIIIKEEKLCSYFTLISMIVHIILTVFLVRRYGIIGAGISTFVSYSLFIILGFISSKTREFSARICKMFIKPALAGLCMGILLESLQLNYIVEFVLGIIIYLLILLIVGGFTEQDRIYIREMFAKK